MPGPPSPGSGGAAAAVAGRRAGGAGSGSLRSSMLPHAGTSRSHAVSRVVRRKTNRRHMTGDHHGRTARRATLLVTATDEILGTHSRTNAGARPPREGTALCQGIVFCGACGRSMQVRYQDRLPRYECGHSRATVATPLCGSVRADTIDAVAADALLATVAPDQVTLALAAAARSPTGTAGRCGPPSSPPSAPAMPLTALSGPSWPANQRTGWSPAPAGSPHQHHDTDRAPRHDEELSVAEVASRLGVKPDVIYAWAEWATCQPAGPAAAACGSASPPTSNTPAWNESPGLIRAPRRNQNPSRTPPGKESSMKSTSPLSPTESLKQWWRCNCCRERSRSFMTIRTGTGLRAPDMVAD